ncbi:MAG: type II toxin-antitoxin system VapC family toxin [Verrucomicrobiales bacterium]
MRAIPLIDTHIWLWWIEGSPDLRRADRDALDSFTASERPRLSVISLWEVSVLVSRGRYQPGRPPEEWLPLAAGPATLALAPITPTVARELFLIPSWFHRDPADQIIVATARAMQLPLMTYDERIRKSDLVTLWKA